MDKELLKNIYRKMLLIRECEESLVDGILKREIKTPCHLYSGQEAVAAGVCSALNKDDVVFSNHRGHGHYLAKGGDLKQLISEIYTKENGCSNGRGGSMHLVSKENGFYGSAPIVAGTISLAVGSALANKIKGNSNVSVSFFGDGATGEGVLYESMNFAALKKLPVIFACENNFYSTHLAVKEIRPDVQIFKIAEPFGIKTFQVDGNDALKVYETAKNAVELCRKGDGPVFIEMLTYRLRGHVGPDDNIQGDHIDIRPESEIENWKRKDPIPRFERDLWDKNILNEKEIADIKEEIKKEVEEAHKFAKESANPNELEKNIFV